MSSLLRLLAEPFVRPVRRWVQRIALQMITDVNQVDAAPNLVDRVEFLEQRVDEIRIENYMRRDTHIM